MLALNRSQQELINQKETYTEQQIIHMWLHGKSELTQKKYQAEINRFLSWVAKPLHTITLMDIQNFIDTLTDLAPATQARIIATIKSLFSFANRIGMLQVNVAAPVTTPKQKNTLAERILSEGDIHRMIALEPNDRNRILLRFMYATGARVSEVSRVKWRDLIEREEGGQVTLFGKGKKTRVVLLPPSIWEELLMLKADSDKDAPLFVSRKKHGHLDSSQIFRIVKEAAKRAGLGDKPSPHFYRHAHASHALDRGAPIHLVQTTLGHESVATTGRYLHARPTDSSSRYLPI